MFAGPGAELRGTIERNLIRNVPVGVALTEAPGASGEGLVDVLIAGCLIAGEKDLAQDSPRRGLLHAIQLALESEWRTSIRVIQSTLAYGAGHAVADTRLHGALENVGRHSVEVIGCVLWGFEQEDFGAEAGGLPLPEYYRRVESSILGRSERVGSAGNVAVDPRLEEGTLQLGAESPAIDQMSFDQLPIVSPLDINGRCRIAVGRSGLPRSDLGAEEFPGPCAEIFVRGDCDANRELELTDGIAVFSYLFLGGAARCLDACDADDTGDINITDGIYVVTYLFTGGPEPKSPFASAGMDATPDALGDCTRG